MGVGHWLEERKFEFHPDTVYETLLAVLVHRGLKIERWDAHLRVMIAYPDPSWSRLFRNEIDGRVAASVEPSGELAALVTIESGPSYEPSIESWHKKHVQQILTALSQALGEPQK